MFDAGKLRSVEAWMQLDSRRRQLRSVESLRKAEVGRW